MKRIYYILLFLVTFVPALLVSQNVIPKWQHCYGGTEMDAGYSLISINDKYKVIGCTESDDGDISFNHGSWDIWMLDIDENGNLISEKTFGGSYLDGDFVDIKMLNDSLYYIVGITKSVDGDISYNPWPGPLGNFWILQVNSDNEIVWEHVHGGSFKEEIRHMTITSDGGLLTLGLTASEDGDISNHFGDYDLWMIKLNLNGVKQWDFSLGGMGFEEGGSVKQTIDGGYIIGGSTDGHGGGNYDTICNYHGEEGESGGWLDAWVIKLDSLRNIEWQQCYGGKYHDDIENIIEVDDGYIVAAVTMSNDGDVTGFHGVPGNHEYGTDIWVFKIDKQGNLLWQYCYGDIGKEELYRGVIQKSDFNYVITLGTNSDDWQCNINTAYPDLRIAQLYDSTLVGTNGDNIINSSQYNIIASPNPAKDKITFTYNLPESTNQYHELYIFNSKGVVVDKVILDSYLGRVILDINSLEAGLYFYSVTLGNSCKNGKFVVSK